MRNSICDPRDVVTNPFSSLTQTLKDLFRPLDLSDWSDPIWFKNDLPQSNAFVDGKNFIVESAVPGMDETNVSITVKDIDGSKYLEVEGKVTQTTEDVGKTKKYDYREYRQTSFKRLFLVPENVTGEPTAVIKNGVLTITWPLKEYLHKSSDEPKKIPIKRE